MKTLIKNGKVVDPANNCEAVQDILIEGAKISRVAKDIKIDADKIIDASGRIIIPGIVDMHVHLREPGREDKETVSTGTGSALKGGVTSILAMPNTSPAMDSEESIELLKGIIKKTAKSNVFICGAITKDRLGKELTGVKMLKDCGAVAISDDGLSVDDAGLLSEAFKQAKAQGIPVICHCEDRALTAGGVVNLGFTSTRMGLRGISKESEYKRVERDIDLAEKEGTALHIAHVSCRESVEIIAKAKKKGIKVTCEAAPHHFSLSDEAVLRYDTNMKMNPPLRSRDDVTAVRQGLADGTIDAIASDHAPHTENEKEIEFERAEFGVVGLETELAVSVTELIQTKLLSWSELAAKLSLNPSRILGVNKGSLSVGADADLAIVAPEAEWLVKKTELISKSKNSSFLGKKLIGLVEFTICGGNIAYQYEVPSH